MTEQLTTREAARIELVRHPIRDAAELDAALRHAVRLACETLRVSRVSLWLFDPDLDRMRCMLVHAAGGETTEAEETLALSRSTRYVASLDSRRALAIDDAHHDERTSELLAYLERHDIVSILDCPILEQGHAIGVLCHEQVGTRRVFTKDEAHFASTVADMVGLYFEQDARRRATEELLETRASLERSHVMESLGRMATAVAHDFNNILAAIAVQAAVVRRHVASATPPPEKLAAGLESLVEQGARLVHQLVSVARQEPTREATIDLVEVLHAMEPLFETFARDGIEVVHELPHDAVKVRLDRSRAEQVLMNLAVNARDAMLGGGTLTLGIEATPEWARLRVADTGVGMDEHVLSRIFEPFFTTKPKGKGNGLGLATVYSIVTSTEGTITVDSAVGEGTTFVVAWPAVR